MDENKRIHLELPLYKIYSRGAIQIPLSERKALLDEVGALDIPIGQEEIEARKSYYFFRNIEQVKGK